MPEFRTAIDAWAHLASLGGIEAADRDEALVEELKDALDHTAPDLETALRHVSIERLLNKLFGILAEPFVGMMRDLLDYFEQAQVKEGPTEFRLVLGGTEPLEANLDYFREALKRISDSYVSRDVPVLDLSNAFRLQKPFRSLPSLDVLPPEAAAWQNPSKVGFSEPLPPLVLSLVPHRTAVGDYAALIYDVSTYVTRRFRDYDELDRDPQRRRVGDVRDDYADIEHDRWTRYSILNLYSYQAAPKGERQRVESELGAMIAGMPRRPSVMPAGVDTLKDLLSLPLWKKRNELYSAWVFTALLHALDGHEIELHSEDGALIFAFHETKLATVRSLPSPLEVVAEKWIAAIQPLQSKKRKYGIQPDYSLWSEDGKRCVLAIECKHYKQSSKTNFRDALWDYANNLPSACAVLVNYGPVNDSVMKELPDELRERSRVWARMNPTAPAIVAEFRQFVRQQVGQPNVAGAGPARPGSAEVLAIDVTASMFPDLHSDEAEAFIFRVIEEWGVRTLAAVDDAVRGSSFPEKNDLRRLLTGEYRGATALLAPILELQKQYGTVLLLTDSDGEMSMGSRGEAIAGWECCAGKLRLVRAVGEPPFPAGQRS